MAVSDMIVQKQEASMRQRALESRRHKFDFYITNNMFDDTKLFVGGFDRGRNRQCVIAASGQATWKLNGDSVARDEDVIIPPTVLKRYTAAACRQVVAAPEDPSGIAPVAGASRPPARFVGKLDGNRPAICECPVVQVGSRRAAQARGR